MVAPTTPSWYIQRMKVPNNMQLNYPIDPAAWARGMERIRKLAPWQQALMDPELVAEALSEDETKLVVDSWRF